jgi:hypothetical protein
VFLYPVGSVGHVLHSDAPRPQNIDELFFLLGLKWYGFDKKCIGTPYAKLVAFHTFLHLVGSMGHVVLFVASGV